MGRYINRTTKGPLGPVDKVVRLVGEASAVIVFQPSFPPPPSTILICVVENGPFEAAAIIYSAAEFLDFNDPNDFRPKTWLHTPDVLATVNGHPVN